MGLRLGCGGLLGCFVFLPVAYRLQDAWGDGWWAALGLAVLLTAFAALRYGDRMWRALGDGGRWIRALWPW